MTTTKPIPGFPGYYITTEGTVLSKRIQSIGLSHKHDGHTIAVHTNQYGHKYVALKRRGKLYTRAVLKLAANVFNIDGVSQRIGRTTKNITYVPANLRRVQGAYIEGKGVPVSQKLNAVAALRRGKTDAKALASVLGVMPGTVRSWIKHVDRYEAVMQLAQACPSCKTGKGLAPRMGAYIGEGK